VKANSKLTEALHILRGHAAFKVFVEHLEQERENLITKAVWGGEGKTDEERGQAQHADALVKLIRGTNEQ